MLFILIRRSLRHFVITLIIIIIIIIMFLYTYMCSFLLRLSKKTSLEKETKELRCDLHSLVCALPS